MTLLHILEPQDSSSNVKPSIEWNNAMYNDINKIKIQTRNITQSKNNTNDNVTTKELRATEHF